ncbi:periplasmic binding protein-like I [Hesseltinella vesiculosa]|uniref:Periplasmic binding protein-like I n=1 Tax=Hesseltinella vesiculosa TaxID=101127 RepID=A0A1X2GMP6_9FUNG|nr:periplasmic binding protein-like I [Hesseltinella vesiculosa]
MADPANIRSLDPALNNMIITSDIAIRLAQQHIQQQAYLSDVNLVFQRAYSSDFNGGMTSWATSELILNGTNAVIGDMTSNSTVFSAAMTGMFAIPQCSAGAVSLDLSNKSIYPYFFRSVPNVISYGSALMVWIQQMDWSMFALLYTDDQVGQQILSVMLNSSASYGITPMSQIQIHTLDHEEIQGALLTLSATGSRIVIVADSDPLNQVIILQQAQTLGMLEPGWVWMMSNDLSEVLAEVVPKQDLPLYNGLMFISGLWNITDAPDYNNLYQVFNQMPMPNGYIGGTSDWQINGLSYNAPNAYACAELLALGLNKRLNEYPGGRQAGLKALQSKTFNSTDMTPLFYNMNYSGPAGGMSFSPSGDLQSGHFGLNYMMNGLPVEYAQIHDGIYSPDPGASIVYLGSTTNKPSDLAESTLLNPTYREPQGIALLVVAGLGLFISLVTMILIFCYRHLTMIMVSSPIFLLMQLMGIALAYSSMILYMCNPTPSICIARQFFVLFGFILVTTSIIAKNYRIYRVFQNVFTLQASKLKSMYLLRFVLAIACTLVLPMVVWNGLYPVTPQRFMVTANTYCVICVYPTSNKSVDWVTYNIAEITTLLFCLVLVGISALLAWKTRRVSGKWSESQQVGYVSYTIALASICVIPAIFLPVDQYQAAIYLKLGALFFAATVTLVALFAPKLITIGKYMLTEQRWSWTRNLYKLHGDHDMGDGRLDSSSQLTNVYEFKYDNRDENHDALIARNLLDRDYHAYEGVLPVKKRGRFHFMSIWELKKVIVIPSNQVFVLVSPSGESYAHFYHYESCYPLQQNANGDRHIFCVNTLDRRQFFFQVFDQKALDRWVDWFNGPTRAGPGQPSIPSPPRSNSSPAKQGNKLPSTSTLGVFSTGDSSTGLTTNQTDSSNFSHTGNNAIGVEPRLYQLSPTATSHVNEIESQPRRHPRSSFLSAFTSGENPSQRYSAFSANTLSFYQPQLLQHRNDSNPISTFGINEEDEDRYSYSSLQPY